MYEFFTQPVVKTGSALVDHKISASPPNPDICALMSTRPVAAQIRSPSPSCLSSLRVRHTPRRSHCPSLGSGERVNPHSSRAPGQCSRYGCPEAPTANPRLQNARVVDANLLHCVMTRLALSGHIEASVRLSASLIGRLGQALSGYPPLQCRCRSRARASLRTRHQVPSIMGIRRRGGTIFWAALPSV